VKALEGVDDDVDYTLLDCPPSLFHLTQLGLACAHRALAVTQPEFDSVQAAVRYRDFIRERGVDLSNPGLGVLGVIPTDHDQRRGGHVFQLDGLPGIFGPDLVWAPVVPSRSVVADADEAAAPLSAYPGKPAAEVRAVYAQLAQRLVKDTATR